MNLNEEYLYNFSIKIKEMDNLMKEISNHKVIVLFLWLFSIKLNLNLKNNQYLENKTLINTV